MNPQNNSITEFMLNRRSVLIKNMLEPGPNSKELETILTIATRVPDHRKLEPWRLLVLQGEARREFGEKLAAVKSKKQLIMGIQVEIEKDCFMRAPLVIAVIAVLHSNAVAQDKSMHPQMQQNLQSQSLRVYALFRPDDDNPE